jgi:hypothetical protein
MPQVPGGSGQDEGSDEEFHPNELPGNSSSGLSTEDLLHAKRKPEVERSGAENSVVQDYFGRGPSSVDPLEEYAAQVLSQPEAPPLDAPSKDDNLESYAAQVLSQPNQGEEQEKRLSVAHQEAIKSDPAKAARVLELEKMTGLPADFIEENKDDVEHEVRGGAFNPGEFRAKSPKLAEWLSQKKQHMAAAQNDLDWFSQLEGHAEDAALSEQLWNGLGSGMAQLYSSAAKVPAFLYDLAATPQNYAAEKLDLPGLKTTAPDWLAKNSSVKTFDDMASRLQPDMADDSIVEEIGKGNYKKAAQVMAVQLVTNAPNQAALIMSEIASYGAAGLVGAGLTTAAQKNEENKKNGVSPALGALNAAANGTIESGFESLGTFGLLKTWENKIVQKFGKDASKAVFKDLLKTLGYTVLGEANEEFMTSLAQDALDATTTNPEAMTGSLGRAADAGIIGGASGFALTSPGGAVAGAMRVQSDVQAKAQIKRQEQFFKVLEAGAESELYKNAPAKIQEAVNHLTAGTPMKDVAIAPEVWNTFWQSQGVDPKAKAAEVIGDGGVSYEQALQSGEELVIPTGAYTAKIIGTDAHAALRPDVRLGVNGVTFREVEKADAEAKALREKHDEEYDAILDEFTNAARLSYPDESETTVKRLGKDMTSMVRRIARGSRKSMQEVKEQFGIEIQKRVAGQMAKEPAYQQGERNPEWLDENKRRDAKWEKNPEQVDVTPLNVGEKKGFRPAEILKGIIGRDNLQGKVFTNKATGMNVEIAKPGLLETASKNRGRTDEVLRAAMENLPQLIERAIYDRVKLKEDITDPKDKNVLKEHWLYAPVEVRGQIRLVSIHVKEIQFEDTGEKKFYFERVSEEGRPASSSRSTSPNESGEVSVGTHGPAKISIKQVREILNAERKNFPLYQTAPAEQGRNLSLLGFYSQVEEAVSKIDFKSMPAKDLAGRIANIQGLKKDELEHLGLLEWLRSNDGKVAKEEVLAFIADKLNLLKVDQIVLAQDFQAMNKKASSRDASNLPTPDELSWDDGALQEPDSDYISESVHENLKEDLRVGPDYRSRKWIYDLEGEDHIKGMKEIEGNYYGQKYVEKYDELRQELEPEYTDQDSGEVDEEGLDAELRKQLQKYVERELFDEAYDNEFQSYMDNDGHGSGYYHYRESETGWELRGSDEMGDWYSPDTGKNYRGNLEEAKIKLLEDMVEEGVVSWGQDYDELVDEFADGFAKNRPALPAPDDVNKPTGKARWEQYTVPGATNYREVLLTLPNIGPEKFKYTTHFNEENFVAHARISDRVGPNGEKILFIEEVQSDWHQQGREKGYQQPGLREELKDRRRITEAKLDVLYDEAAELIAKDDPGTSVHAPMLLDVAEHPAMFKKLSPEAVAKAKVYAELRASLDQIMNEQVALNDAVPDAPFKNTESWSALVLKRMIRMAVEQGYDSIAWTPGEVHVERWGTDSISWVKKNFDTSDWKLIPPAKDRVAAFNRIEGEIDAAQAEIDRLTVASLVEDKSDTETEEKLRNARNQKVQLELKKKSLNFDSTELKWRVEGHPRGAAQFRTEEEAKKYIEENTGEHWLVGSVEQVGGNAAGQNIEEMARRRGELLERRGERVTSKEQLREVIASTLHRERNDRSLESLTESVWKQMQSEQSGVKAPRKEGMEFFYDNLLPKKVAPAVLKQLDKSAKVTVGEIATQERKSNFEIKPVSDGVVVKSGGHYTEEFTIADHGSAEGAMKAAQAWVEKMSGTMKVWSVPLTQAMRENALKGMTLFQAHHAGALGAMNVSASGKINVDIFAKADLSTWYHEMAHVYLEIMHRLQSEEGASEEIKREFRVATEWFEQKDQGKTIAEVKSAAAAAIAAAFDQPENQDLQEQAEKAKEALDLIEKGGEEFMREVARTFGRNVEDEQVRHILITPFHEYLARGFEKYLGEGVAPTPELKSFFRRMARWLVKKYKGLANLNVDLSPEIRQFFDRMLATDEEIEHAERETGMATPLVVSPSEVLSEDDARRYSDAVNEARGEARERMNARLMKDVVKERTEWWNAERERVREDVADQVNLQKVYVALAFLGKGVQADGSPLPEGMMPVKISRQSIVEKYGEERLKRLPKPYVYTADGGEDVDSVAEFFEYGSGDEMLSAFESAEPKDELIEKVTDAQMQALHGDKALDEQLPKEVLDAVHSEKQAELLRMEMKFLVENKLGTFQKAIRQVGKGVPTVAAVRAQAEEIVAKNTIRDIQPVIYQRAEKKASKAAIEALSKGDLAKAFEEKRKQLLNHELYRAARAAREKAEKYADYAHGLNKPAAQQRIGKAQGEYLDQVNAILDRFNFNTGMSLRRADGLKSLAQWIEERKAEGQVPAIPEKLLDEAYRKHFKDMTFQELKDVYDALKNITYLARTKNKLLAEKRAREFAEVKNDILSSIGAHHDLNQEPEDLHPSLGKKLVDAFETARAKHTRMEILFEFLDGNKAGGAVWGALFRKAARAQSRKTELLHGSDTAMEKILEAYSEKERKDLLTTKYFIQDFGDSPIIKPNFTKQDMLVVALNWGNEGNRQALMQGYGWTESQVQKILSRLDDRDWNVVEGIWAHVDSFWPEIAKQEKLLTGVVPEKIQASPFMVGTREIRGGYYPLKYDSRFDEKTRANQEAERVQDMFGGGFARAATRHGHTQERVQNHGRKVHLDLSVLATHLNTVIHDLTHRVAVMDMVKIVEDPEIFGAIRAAAGRRMAEQIKPWLAHVAGSRQVNPDEHYSKFFNFIKQNSTMVFLGFKFTSALVQLVDIPVAANEVGERWMLRGFREAYLNNKISDSWAFATERSEHMRNLIEHKQREITELLKDKGLLEGKSNLQHFKELAMKPAHWMDSGIALAIWTGAYYKALEGHLENIEKGDEKAAAEYADRTVRTTQMAGDPKDEAAIQRGNALWKLFTQFYTPMSVAFNQMQKHLVMETQLNGFQAGQFAHAAINLIFLPVLIEGLIKAKLLPGGDDDEEKSWLWSYLSGVLAYPFEHVIGLRDLVKFAGGDKKNFSPSPAFSALESVKEAATAASGAASSGELDRKTVKAATMAAGYLGGLPARQFWLTSEYAYDWLTGEENPSTPVEGAWRALVTGKPRKK